jgi:hypothetical protein
MFAVFYIFRMVLMDLAYVILVLIYVQKGHYESTKYLRCDFLLGENNPVLIVMYTFDFGISFIMLRLFNIYADKSSSDENKLKNMYLMSL